jgi:hypothetical protein
MNKCSRKNIAQMHGQRRVIGHDFSSGKPVYGNRSGTTSSSQHSARERTLAYFYKDELTKRTGERYHL